MTTCAIPISLVAVGTCREKAGATDYHYYEEWKATL